MLFQHEKWKLRNRVHFCEESGVWPLGRTASQYDELSLRPAISPEVQGNSLVWCGVYSQYRVLCVWQHNRSILSISKSPSMVSSHQVDDGLDHKTVLVIISLYTGRTLRREKAHKYMQCYKIWPKFCVKNKKDYLFLSLALSVSPHHEGALRVRRVWGRGAKKNSLLRDLLWSID